MSSFYAQAAKELCFLDFLELTFVSSLSSHAPLQLVSVWQDRKIHLSASRGKQQQK